MTNGTKSLEALRREIDRIDDTIHDLIMRRTTIVEKVRNLKRYDRIKIRPAREAAIVYRLIARHRGPFPKRELIRIWRELIVATLAFEGPFSVAVYMPEDGAGYWDLARDQYGSFTPMKGFASARGVIQAVRNQNATVGVLPVPRPDDSDPWWRHLVVDSSDTPRVIARLPMAGAGNSRDRQPEALVICPVNGEPTGRDRTYLAVEAEDKIGGALLARAFAAVGLAASSIAVFHDSEAPPSWLHLVEVEGFMKAGDHRLDGMIETLTRPVRRVLVLGSFAEPLSARELDKVVPLAAGTTRKTGGRKVSARKEPRP